VKAARSTFLRQINAGAGAAPDPYPHEGGGRHWAIWLQQGVTVGLRCIQAFQVCCDVKGVHLVRERPVKMSRRKGLLHSAVAEFSPITPRSLYLTNIGDVPVHLTKGYVIGTATANNGPLHVGKEEEEPRAVLTMGVDPRDKPDEEFKTSRQAEEGIYEGQPPTHPPDKTYPKPEVHWDGVPGTLRGAMDDLLEEYKALWAEGTRQGRCHPASDRGDLRGTATAGPTLSGEPCFKDIIAKEVQRKRDLGVIEPSSAEWAFPVILVPKSDGTMRFFVDYRQFTEVTVRDVYPLPRIDDCIDFLGTPRCFRRLTATRGTCRSPWRTRTGKRRPSFVMRGPFVTSAFLSVCLMPRRPSNGLST